MATRDTVKLRNMILQNLMVNKDYASRVLPFLDQEYFVERSEKIIYDEITKYYHEYGEIPPHKAVAINVESRNDLTEAVYNEVNAILENEEPPYDNALFLVKATEEWCRERATVNAITKGVAVLGGDEKKMDMGGVIELLREATSLQFDNKIGHDYFDDAMDRHDFYIQKEDKLPTGIEHLDYILKGGIPPKTLGVFLAGTGVGKSLFMCSLSANFIKSGQNVLYITMEMAEEKIAQRIDQNLMNMSSDELERSTRDTFANRIDKLKQKTQGQLVVKEYPTKSAHAGHFEALLKELERKKDFKPEIICVDYLNICKSMSAGKNANSYEQSKSVAEELRSVAMKYGVSVITATQTNRAGMNDTDADMTSVSESFGVPMTADYMFLLSTNDHLRSENQISFKQLKNRFSDPKDREYWLLGVDYTHMRVSDLDKLPTEFQQVQEAKTEGTPLMDVKWG
ncbi:MAG: AAA family ATPase [Candidatus Thiodiazotropha taylori]|uniref:AAA family ATPase n=1 Tax=Candidatus Thiodiazotropha taylori TaxID=2792791 RepID=A0A9E4K810_9GAMM|nr:AAA family ATPase [Candidatus Thiodiazotropha taylori]MCW4254905.1 AAA family ATPase [Candidatus Thiodiazotropha taylori]